MPRKTSQVSGGDTGLTSQYNFLRDEASASSFLLPYQQAVPNLTLIVSPAVIYFGHIKVEFAGGNSPSFTAPAANPRIDILSINTSGVLVRTAGTEAASPTTPAVPDGNMPICSIYNRVGQTSIKNTDDGTNGYVYKDLRIVLFQSKVGAIVSGSLQVINPSVYISSQTTIYTKGSEIQVYKGGTYSVYFELRTNNESYLAYARIYKNGVAVGTERSTNSTTFVGFVENISLVVNDLIQLYYKATPAVAYVEVFNFILRAKENEFGQVLL